jgi:stearoyl-CoA desaturase (delta-9 desaturase)
MTPPSLNRDEMYERANTVADRHDPAFSPPLTPESKTAEPTGINALAGINAIQPTLRASDEDIPDNYVSATIAKQKYLPPVTWKNLLWNIQWISFLAITVTPSVAIYGMFTTSWNTKTAIWA